jgi:hypothetical protein
MFLELELATQEGEGGYAREQSEAFLNRQQSLLFTQQILMRQGAPPKIKMRSPPWPLLRGVKGKKSVYLQAEPGQVTQVESRSSAASLNNKLTGDTFRHHQMSLSYRRSTQRTLFGFGIPPGMVHRQEH